MDLMQTTQSYLKSIAKAVSSLSKMVRCRELDDKPEIKHKLIISMLELEQSTADFISETGFDCDFPEIVKTCKEGFVSSNQRVIGHLKKIQLQGANFTEFETALKLENQTLKEEIHFL